MKTHLASTIILTATTTLLLSVALAAGCKNQPPPPPNSSEAHAVHPEKELFITNSAIIELGRSGAPEGEKTPLHFRSVLAKLAGDADLETFAENWFSGWESQTTVSGSSQVFQTRPDTANAIRQAWRENRIRLIAIVNRIDLTRFENNNPEKTALELGEGRLVYEFIAPGSNGSVGRPMAIILEFGLEALQAPATTDLKPVFLKWARRWHALGESRLGRETEFGDAYRSELLSIVRDYATPKKLRQLRTNEFVTSPWQLREFKLVGDRLIQVPVAMTPAAGTGTSSQFGGFVTVHEDRILSGIPVNSVDRNDGNMSDPEWPAFQGAVADADSPGFTWRIPETSARARFIVSFNTCNGCHTGDSADVGTGSSRTLFQHIGLNAPDRSPFLTREITLAQALPGKSDPLHDEMSERAKFLAIASGDVSRAIGLGASERTVNDIVEARAARVH